MLRFFGTIIGLWVFAFVAILTAMKITPSHPCLRPVAVRYGSSGGDIVDYGSGIMLQAPYIEERGQSLSPDGKYFTFTEYPASGDEIHITSTEDNSSRLIYTNSYSLGSSWAVDSRLLFISEHSYEGERGISQGLFAINLDTGDVVYEYDSSARVVSQSPDYQYLLVTLLDESSDGYYLASIDTRTGILRAFDESLSHWNELWSPDSRWVILWHVDNDSFFVIDPQTGRVHPLISEVIEGNFLTWTDDSFWFTRESNGISAIWRVSISDGTFHLEEEYGYLFWVSDDDRWAIIGTQYNTLSGSFLYDLETQTQYPDVNIIRPYFSEDRRCLIAEQINLDTNSADVVIFDLNSVEIVFRKEIGYGSGVLSYLWYEAD